jgi:hypothetical protein
MLGVDIGLPFQRDEQVLPAVSGLSTLLLYQAIAVIQDDGGVFRYPLVVFEVEVILIAGPAAFIGTEMLPDECRDRGFVGYEASSATAGSSMISVLTNTRGPATPCANTGRHRITAPANATHAGSRCIC